MKAYNNSQTVVAIALLLSTVFVISVLLLQIRHTQGAEQQLCQLEPAPYEGWHYRTKVGNRPERCWYLGPRMKPRHELYWAEAPKIAPMEQDRPPWARGALPGWDHRE